MKYRWSRTMSVCLDERGTDQRNQLTRVEHVPRCTVQEGHILVMKTKKK